MADWEDISQLSPQNHWVTTSANTISQALILVILVYRITLSSLFDPRCAHLPFRSRLRKISLATHFLWAMMFTSWALVASIDLFQTVYDMSEKKHCNLVLTFCLFLYSAVKLLLYMYLIERAHVLHGGPRSKDSFYAVNLALSGLFGTLVLSATLMRYIKAWHTHCYIGYEDGIITAAAVYEVLVNVFWSAQFIIPVIRITHRMKQGAKGLQSNHEMKLRKVAFLSGLGSIGTLLLTCLNFGFEQYMRPRVVPWVCLLICMIDIACSCVVMHFTTPIGHGSEVKTNDVLPRLGDVSLRSPSCCCTLNSLLDSSPAPLKSKIENVATLEASHTHHISGDGGGNVVEKVIDTEIQLASRRADVYAA